jgi:hypothetical protein
MPKIKYPIVMNSIKDDETEVTLNLVAANKVSVQIMVKVDNDDCIFDNEWDFAFHGTHTIKQLEKLALKNEKLAYYLGMIKEDVAGKLKSIKAEGQPMGYCEVGDNIVQTYRLISETGYRVELIKNHTWFTLEGKKFRTKAEAVKFIKAIFKENGKKFDLLERLFN